MAENTRNRNEEFSNPERKDYELDRGGSSDSTVKQQARKDKDKGTYKADSVR